MELELVQLPEQNEIMEAYNNDKAFIHTYFDYENKASAFPERVEELKKRAFKREEVAQVIRSFMEPFGLSDCASRHIDELADDAVTVVGGQQAGILTGPLYSIHKAITVILLARQQRAVLDVPVVPIFWVAGEDHDLNEINHVYTETDGQVAKEQIQDQFVLKLMASEAVFNQQEMTRFIKGVFKKFGETPYTGGLLEEVLQAVKKERTFTGFFVRLMNGLFAEEGLLFIDSAYEPLRQLEGDYFHMLITKSKEIATAVSDMESRFADEGFGSPVKAEEDAAHLFYIHSTGRVLLSRENGDFVNESAGIRFTEAELLTIAAEEPWLLSNNVTTRPLMQDLVFPVLAFVGGPGEIAYWALLKEAFHLLEMKMPIIVPRMSFTLVSRRVQKALQEQSFTVEDVMAGSVPQVRETFLEAIRDDQFEKDVEEAEQMLTAEYEKIGKRIGMEEKMLQELLHKNIHFHSRQFDYLKRKAEEVSLQKHEATLRTLSVLEVELLPNGTLQERVYTPYMYLNHHGPKMIQELLKLPLEVDSTHKVVYL